jgi:hypothetical protein
MLIRLPCRVARSRARRGQLELEDQAPSDAACCETVVCPGGFGVVIRVGHTEREQFVVDVLNKLCELLSGGEIPIHPNLMEFDSTPYRTVILADCSEPATICDGRHRVFAEYCPVGESDDPIRESCSNAFRVVPASGEDGSGSKAGDEFAIIRRCISNYVQVVEQG